MLEYINIGTTNDFATKSLENEVNEARLKEEWRAEYMLTLVHDIDMRREGFEEGFESRQEEVDSLNATISRLQAQLDDLLKSQANNKNQASE